MARGQRLISKLSTTTSLDICIYKQTKKITQIQHPPLSTSLLIQIFTSILQILTAPQDSTLNVLTLADMEVS